MNRHQIETCFAALKSDREQWKKARAEFDAEHDKLFTRLLRESAVSLMSVEQIARASGLTPKRVRAAMRGIGLNPTMGRSPLALSAAEALIKNADLLDIDPSQMDLTSPLAYLPMGSKMKAELAAATNVTEVEE